MKTHSDSLRNAFHFTLHPSQRLVSRVATAICVVRIGLSLGPPAHAGLGVQPEAIVPTNTLPPAAGTYLLRPPETTVKFNGTLAYQGTNYPTIFHLQQIEAGPFTNIVRSVAGNDLVLEFDAFMNTQIPYVNLVGTIGSNVALYDQIGHFRIRIKEGNAPATNRLTLIMEMFSWTYRAKNAQGEYFDFIYVRNSTNHISSGWIETTNLSASKYLMQSELLIYPEGIVLCPPFETDYVLAENVPVRLVLKGIARTLQVLHVARNEQGEFQMYSSYLGPGYRYGLDYTTNGINWTEFTVPTVYGDRVNWFDDTEAWRWSENTTNASMKWFRLKAQARP